MSADVVERVARAMDDEATKREKRFGDLTDAEAEEVIDWVLQHGLTAKDAALAIRALENQKEEDDG